VIIRFNNNMAWVQIPRRKIKRRKKKKMESDPVESGPETPWNTCHEEAMLLGGVPFSATVRFQFKNTKVTTTA
jgi:hypothetical protein